MTPKQSKFAELYVQYGSASEAYRQAYDVDSNTLPSTIHCNASQLLNNTEVTQRISEIQKEQREQFQIDRDFVVDNYLRIIRQVDYVFDLAMVQSSNKETSKQFYKLMNIVKMSDKIKAIEKLSKMLGLDEPEETPQEKIQIEIIQVDSTHERPEGLD